MDVWISEKVYKKWALHRKKSKRGGWAIWKNTKINKHQKGRAITKEEVELLKKNGIIKT